MIYDFHEHLLPFSTLPGWPRRPGNEARTSDSEEAFVAARIGLEREVEAGGDLKGQSEGHMGMGSTILWYNRRGDITCVARRLRDWRFGGCSCWAWSFKELNPTSFHWLLLQAAFHFLIPSSL